MGTHIVMSNVVYPKLGCVVRLGRLPRSVTKLHFPPSRGPREGGRSFIATFPPAFPNLPRETPKDAYLTGVLFFLHTYTTNNN